MICRLIQHHSKRYLPLTLGHIVGGGISDPAEPHGPAESHGHRHRDLALTDVLQGYKATPDALYVSNTIESC